MEWDFWCWVAFAVGFELGWELVDLVSWPRRAS
jgi:hypothetical protein